MSLSAAEKEKLISFLPSSIRSSESLDSWIEGAEFRVSREYFGKAYVYALSRVVAHKATLDDMAKEGVSGAVTSKREGDIAVNYGAGGDSAKGDFGLSVYGREYLELLDQYKPSPGVAGGLCLGGFDGGDRFQSFL